MNKQTLGIIGLIGGIMAIGSMALTWGSASVTVSVLGYTYATSAESSGIDALRAGGESACMSALVLVGGILALVGGIGTLAAKKVPGYLLPLGGILALAGGIWAFARIAQVAGAVAEAAAAVAGVSVSASIGYGVYVAIVGAILALVASLGLRGK